MVRASQKHWMGGPHLGFLGLLGFPEFEKRRLAAVICLRESSQEIRRIGAFGIQRVHMGLNTIELAWSNPNSGGIDGVLAKLLGLASHVYVHIIHLYIYMYVYIYMII